LYELVLLKKITIAQVGSCLGYEHKRARCKWHRGTKMHLNCTPRPIRWLCLVSQRSSVLALPDWHISLIYLPVWLRHPQYRFEGDSDSRHVLGLILLVDCTWWPKKMHSFLVRLNFIKNINWFSKLFTKKLCHFWPPCTLSVVLLCTTRAPFIRRIQNFSQVILKYTINTAQHESQSRSRSRSRIYGPESELESGFF